MNPPWELSEPELLGWEWGKLAIPEAPEALEPGALGMDPLAAGVWKLNVNKVERASNKRIISTITKANREPS